MLVETGGILTQYANSLLTLQMSMSVACMGLVESELSAGTSQVRLTAAACWDTESMVEWNPFILPLTELPVEVKSRRLTCLQQQY